MKKVKVTVVRGPTGLLALYVDDVRVAGEKPWGGGAIVKEWMVKREDLLDPDPVHRGAGRRGKTAIEAARS